MYIYIDTMLLHNDVAYPVRTFDVIPTLGFSFF